MKSTLINVRENMVLFKSHQSFILLSKVYSSRPFKLPTRKLTYTV